MREIQNFADHVTLKTDQGSHDFDYVVDCMGTPPSFDGYTMSDCTLMDRCRIHTVEKYDYEPFTDHMLVDWSVSGPASGVGAKARVYSKAGGRKVPVDIEVVESSSPSRNVERNVNRQGLSGY